jgi:hypothetical protein
MKYTLHTPAVDGGPFHCRPAGEWELDEDRILCNDIRLPSDRTNYRNVRLWVVGNEFGPLCAVWASCEQDALDAMVDEGMGNSFLVDINDVCAATDEQREEWAQLGNAGEYADLTHCWLSPVELRGDRDLELVVAFAEARGAGQTTLFK